MSESTQRTSAQGSAEENSTQDPADTRSPEEIQADIEATRQDLGESLEALSGKLDVKSRARAQVQQTKVRTQDQVRVAQARAREVQRAHGQEIAVAAGATALVLVLALVWRRRR